jgi:hypothetical protein
MGREFVDVRGPINPKDDKVFASLVGAHPDPERVIVRLASPGGDFWSGISIADMINKKGLATVVSKGETCASMCAIMWISGSTKAVDDRVTIGFHNMFRSDTKQASGKANAVLGAYLGKIGLDYNAIAWMTEQGADSANWLTPNVAKQFNIKYAFADELPHPVQLPKVTQKVAQTATTAETVTTVNTPNGGQPVSVESSNPSSNAK